MERETSCINSKSIINYVKAHNNGDCSELLHDLDPEIDSLPDPESFLQDPNNWISCAVISKLYKKARLILHDERVAYKIAKYAIENSSLGYIQKVFVKAFWSSKKGFKHAQAINDKFNRSKKVEIVELRRNRAVVRLHWDSSMKLSKDLCLFNQGIYTFLPTIWSGRPYTLKEDCCYFDDGAPYCEYHIKWRFRNKVREYLSRFFTSRTMLKDIIVEQEKDKKIIEQKYDEVNRLNAELNYKIKQLLAVQDTGKAIVSVLDLKQLLTLIMNILSNICEIKRAIIMLVNDKKKSLEYMYGVGFDDEVPQDIRNYTVPLDRLSNIMARVVSKGQSEYIPDINNSTLRKENIVLKRANPTSAFVVPLVTKSKVIGIIATDAVDGDGIPRETRETMEIFAPQIAIAIENAKLYNRLREQMEELKRSQALLSRAEKLSFLGNMAARLAHEIKNPMTAIGTFIQMLPQKYDDEEFRTEFYEIAMEETARINNLIAELMNLAKTRESHFELNDVNKLTDKMILLTSPQSNSKHINIVRNYDPNIGQVWMDSEKMKQVILNLISNAIDFTPDKGRIELTTIKIMGHGKPETVQIEIKDNGPGIPQSIIDKIFDPYFTTRHKSSMHNGTGLGLFIAHKNMQDHGGTIEVKSKVDEGVTFTLTFPKININQCK
jgi:signal transduction histidine kinase